MYEILALPEAPPRREWEEAYSSLPATYAEQSPFQASHWPNSATDLGVWEMQITGISPHPSTQYRAGMGKEKCIWEQKSPRLTQKERLCIHSDRSFRAGRKVTGWEKGRLYRLKKKKLFKGYVLFIAIIKYWLYSLLYNTSLWIFLSIVLCTS